LGKSSSGQDKGEVRGQIKTKIIAAYDSYIHGERGSMDRLLKLVSEFALMKLIHLEHEPDFKQFGSAETADDWAQEVSIKVWQQLLKNKKRTGEAFYAFVHKIAFRMATDAFNQLLEEKAVKVCLFVRSDEEDQDGDKYEEENPEIHAPFYQTSKIVKEEDEEVNEDRAPGPVRHIMKDGKYVQGSGAVL
jgi:hypothetical protein